MGLLGSDFKIGDAVVVVSDGSSPEATGCVGVIVPPKKYQERYISVDLLFENNKDTLPRAYNNRYCWYLKPKDLVLYE